MKTMEKTYTLKIYAPGVNGQWILVESYNGLSKEKREEYMDQAFSMYDYCECIAGIER